jgi:hypothetical protein
LGFEKSKKTMSGKQNISAQKSQSKPTQNRTNSIQFGNNQFFQPQASANGLTFSGGPTSFNQSKQYSQPFSPTSPLVYHQPMHPPSQPTQQRTQQQPLSQSYSVLPPPPPPIKGNQLQPQQTAPYSTYSNLVNNNYNQTKSLTAAATTTSINVNEIDESLFDDLEYNTQLDVYWDALESSEEAMLNIIPPNSNITFEPHQTFHQIPLPGTSSEGGMFSPGSANTSRPSSYR